MTSRTNPPMKVHTGQRPPARSSSTDVADKLRQIILSSEAESFLGSEEALSRKLAASAPTMRQAARILEREGLLRVKRGIGGGYYGTRPTFDTVGAVVSGYLQALGVPQSEVTTIASALWIEAVRQATSVQNELSASLADRFAKQVASIGQNATFDEVSTVELAVRAVIFNLIEAPYIELVFGINSAYALRQALRPSMIDDSEEHRMFVKAWKAARMLELNAISMGEPDVAAAAARHLRHVWDERLSATSRVIDSLGQKDGGIGPS